MRLPRFALIADRFTVPERVERVLTSVRAGTRWVHLRDHQAAPQVFDAAADALGEQLRAERADVIISVNSRLPAAEQIGAGLHLGWRGPHVDTARHLLGRDALIGFSAHEQAEAEGERARQVDYFFFSPVYPTASKPDHPGTGLAELAAFCRAAAPVPVLALGGIVPERVPDCLQAGAHGVAVLSGVMDAAAPAAATRAYVRAVTSAARVR